MGIIESKMDAKCLYFDILMEIRMVGNLVQRLTYTQIILTNVGMVDHDYSQEARREESRYLPQ